MGHSALLIDVSVSPFLTRNFHYGGEIAGVIRVDALAPTLDSNTARTQASSDAAYDGCRICHYPRIHI